MRNVSDVLSRLGAQSSNVPLCMSDSDSPVCAAVKALKVLFPKIVHLVCFGYILDSCGKAMLEAKGFSKITAFWTTTHSFP